MSCAGSPGTTTMSEDLIWYDVDPRPGAEHWFRVEELDKSGGGFDVHGDYHHDRSFTLSLYVRSCRIIRHTPKGVWVEGNDGPRWINREARKRWACPTVEEAVVSFQARKRKQIRILGNQLQVAKMALSNAYRITNTTDTVRVPWATRDYP